MTLKLTTEKRRAAHNIVFAKGGVETK